MKLVMSPPDESARVRALKMRVRQQAAEIYMLKGLLGMNTPTLNAIYLIAYRLAALFGLPRHYDSTVYVVNATPMKAERLVEEVIKIFKTVP